MEEGRTHSARVKRADALSSSEVMNYETLFSIIWLETDVYIWRSTVDIGLPLTRNATPRVLLARKCKGD
jgi:hypothetical protein